MLAFEPESDLCDTVNWNRKWLVNCNGKKTQLVSFDHDNNFGTIDLKFCGSFLDSISSSQCYLNVLSKLVPLSCFYRHYFGRCSSELPQPQSWTKYLRQTLFFMTNRALREKFNFYFSRVFC